MRLYPVLLAAVLSLVFAASASAANILVVNDPADAGDGVCDATPGGCTLRDAVTSAADGDTIEFSLLAPDTQIELTNGPVTVTAPNVTVDGCAPATATVPCVTIHQADAAKDAVEVHSAGVTVKRVAITGAQNGLSSDASGTGLTVTGSWFGVSAAGVATPNDTGISLGGASALIGGTQSDADQATAACDGACNAFAGGTTGIRVNGVADTTIKGNEIGFDGAGNGAPVSGTGIDVQPTSSGTSIGNDLPGEGNAIQAGTYGVAADGAGDTTLRGNLVGLNRDGTAKADAGGVPSAFGILASGPTGAEARLFSNRVAIGGTAGTRTGGIGVGGNNTVLRSNAVGVGTGGQNVGGPASGIVVMGDGAEIGSSDNGAGNAIAHADSGGIDIAGGKNNQLKGNRLTDNGRGVLVHQLDASSGSEASGNVIGGDSTAEGNTIDGSAHDAIALLPRSSDAVGNPNSGNTIGVNTGSGNGSDATKDLFIDLADPLLGGNAKDGPGNTSAVNGGITPPVVTIANGYAIAGTAKPNALVRVFTRSSGIGSLGAYVGKATATSGTWSLPATLPNGTKVVATQTDPTAGTSEVSNERAVDTAPPNTAITGGPVGSTTDTTPTFTFASSESGSTFRCSVDGGADVSCTSPHTTAALGYGSHTFSVKATDASVNTDPTPATRTFTVAKPGTPPPPRDTTPPTTTITKTPGTLTRSREPQFSFKSNEPSYIECSVDGASYQVCGVIGPLKDGRHTLKARAVDGSDNTDPTPATFTFRVDATAPKLKLGATAKRKGKALRIRVACPSSEKSGPCRGTLTAKRKGKLVAKKAYRITAGKTATVVLRPKRMPPKGAKLKLSTTAKDKLGNKRTVRKTAKVR